MIRMSRPLVLAHLAGNAILLWSAYYWLGIGESRAATLLWSALVALAIVGLTCWLHGSAFVYFSQPEPRLKRVFAGTLRRLLPLAAAALLVLTVYWLVAFWAGTMGKPAFQIASYLTLKLRVPVNPPSVLRIFNAMFWLLRWMLVPVLILPAIAAIARNGWSGFRAIGSQVRRRWYWIETPLLLVCAFWVPGKLFAWVPDLKSFPMQMASFLVRVGIGYLLCVAAWLLLVFITAGGSPRLTQAKTVPSP